MLVLQDLEIPTKSIGVDSFIQTLEQTIKEEGGWERAEKNEEGLQNMTPNRFFFFSKKENGILLALTEKKDRSLYVSNVVPRKGSLTINLYNELLVEFFDKFVKPVADDLKIVPILSSAQQTMEDWVSLPTAHLLRKFSSAANKFSGSGHPFDQERWFDFVVSHVEQGDALKTDILIRWLMVEEGWTEDIALELAIQFERETTFLHYYLSRNCG